MFHDLGIILFFIEKIPVRANGASKEEEGDIERGQTQGGRKMLDSNPAPLLLEVELITSKAIVSLFSPHRYSWFISCLSIKTILIVVLQQWGSLVRKLFHHFFNGFSLKVVKFYQL
jgi:hypothetical protein